MARALIETARKTPNLTLLEDHFVIDLITTAKLGAVVDDRVLGAYVLETKTNEVKVFRSDRVILAAGGCGKVYLYTTNPDSATGDGVALGWRAGASIANMEFIQFHPTCFYNPGATGPEARSFLVSEAVRGEGGILINAKGEDFTKKIDPRGSLAPRDIVARAIDREIKRTGAACVYLDVTHKPKGFMKERFPYIYDTLMKFGLDCETQPIPVVPAAHYQCGGVLTDVNGRTTVRGLYAVGEVGCTGLHGANRLASNSLLEGNVVARRALAEMLRLHPPDKFVARGPRDPAMGARRHRGAGRTGGHLSQLGRDPAADVGLRVHRPHRQPPAPGDGALAESQEGSPRVLLGPPGECGHPGTAQSRRRGRPDRRVRHPPQGVARAALHAGSPGFRRAAVYGHRAAEILAGTRVVQNFSSALAKDAVFKRLELSCAAASPQMDETSIPLRVQKKSARWISPRISQRALFLILLLGPRSVDFPPEINSKLWARRFEAGVLSEADLAQNDFKLPDDQEMKGI